jgi:pimeloyl-ACP methyl ester carboxylesterase
VTQTRTAPLQLIERQIHGLALSSLEQHEAPPEAPLLLMLHGFPDTARVWEPISERLKAEYALVAPFVRGTHLPAQIPPRRYRISSWCLDLLSLIQEVDPAQQRPLFIVAHDLGGPYAHALADYLGPRCRGLIFINSLGLPQYLTRADKPRQWLKSYYILLFQLQGLPELLLSQLHPLTLNRIYSLGGMEADDPQRRESKQVFQVIEQYRQIFREAPALLAKRPPKSTVPALFIWGEEDPFLEIPSLSEAEAIYSQAEVRVLPGKHWILRSQADALAKYIRKFCEKRR